MSCFPWRSSSRTDINSAASGRAIRQQANALLDLVGLENFGEKYPWQLSGGMQQRASLCRSLIHEPSLLMLDEPFGALDAFTREELWDVLQDLWLQRRFTTILVTHDLREAVYLADTVHVMSSRPGRIIATHDVPIERPRRPRTSYEPRFIEIVQRIREEICGEREYRPPERAAHPGARVMRSELMERAVPWVASLALLLVWEIGCAVFKVPEFVLPRPTVVVAALVQWAGPIWLHASHTLVTTILGFALSVVAGVLIGIAVGSSRLAYRGFYPMLVGFNSVPKVAIVPVLVIWFGIGTIPAVLTAFLMSFFPIAVNVATGLATVEPEMEDVLRSLGAKPRDIIIKVGLPRAMPYFFASLKVAITLAFVGSVISESIASNRGIGTLMVQASSDFRIALVFAGLLVTAVMGIAMYAGFAMLELRTTRWATRRMDFNSDE